MGTRRAGAGAALRAGLTPVERHGGILVKRDDLYLLGGSRGGKVRTCLALAEAALAGGAGGLVTAGARHSPQVNIVATVGAQLGLPVRVHVPAARGLTAELAAAVAAGAELVEHRPGYNTVIVARAREDAAARSWGLIPFGMEHPEAVTQTAGQVASLDTMPVPARIVVPVGSGMSAAGILSGLRQRGWDIPLLGIVVGASPVRRLDIYAPGWRDQLELRPAGLPYGSPAPYPQLGDLALDAYYEGKCVTWLRADDLFWVVGRRETAKG